MGPREVFCELVVQVLGVGASHGSGSSPGAAAHHRSRLSRIHARVVPDYDTIAWGQPLRNPICACPWVSGGDGAFLCALPLAVALPAGQGIP